MISVKKSSICQMQLHHCWFFFFTPTTLFLTLWLKAVLLNRGQSTVLSLLLVPYELKVLSWVTRALLRHPSLWETFAKKNLSAYPFPYYLILAESSSAKTSVCCLSCSSIFREPVNKFKYVRNFVASEFAIWTPEKKKERKR